MAAALDKRLQKIFRLLDSDQNGEVLAAVGKLKKLCAAEGVSLNDLAISVGGAESPERKYTDDDAVTIFERGKQVGRAEVSDRELEYFDADGDPRWYEITIFNRDHADQIRDAKSRAFATSDIVARVLGREPSPKQAMWILQIFVRLGGDCDPRARGRYFD